VPLDAGGPDGRLAWVAGDAGVSVVVASRGLAGRVPAGCVVVEAEGVVPRAAGAAAGVHRDQAAYVMYTSGSSGRPKGVVVPHGGIVNRVAWMAEQVGLGAGERVLHKAPAGFDVSMWELVGPLAAGGCVVVAAPGGHADAGYLAGLVAAEGVSVAHFVPSMLGPFLAAAEAAGGVPGTVVCSGEALGGGLRDRAAGLGAAVWNLYGPTEASVDVSWWLCGPGERGPVPVGWPVANVGVHVLDRWLQVLPAHAAGEVCVRGVALARGYLGAPGLTAAAFVPDPLGAGGGRLYRTGDRGRRRRDGAVEFLGRGDGQVKIAGNRVELGEVEDALRQVPGVAAAAAAVRDDGTGPRLVAYIVPRHPGTWDRDEIVTRLRARLPAIMVPSAVVPLDQLPVTAAGKLDRARLPPPQAPARRTAPALGLPRGPLERLIADAWCATLSVDRVSVHETFFDAGGNSLLLLELHARLQQELDQPVTVADVFSRPTVSELAEFVGQRAGEHDAARRGADRGRLRSAALAAQRARRGERSGG
jgi:amino acid adenylation domain-containing protein